MPRSDWHWTVRVSSPRVEYLVGNLHLQAADDSTGDVGVDHPLIKSSGFKVGLPAYDIGRFSLDRTDRSSVQVGSRDSLAVLLLHSGA